MRITSNYTILLYVEPLLLHSHLASDSHEAVLQGVVVPLAVVLPALAVVLHAGHDALPLNRFRES